MKEYLKMADVFVGEYKPKRRIDAWPPSRYGETLVELSGSPAQYAVHAINSHDELVAMNKELLEALETVIEWYDMESDHTIEPDFYKRMAACQVSEDMAREAIAKAKAAS
mgnify:FL=1